MAILSLTSSIARILANKRPYDFFKKTDICHIHISEYIL